MKTLDEIMTCATALIEELDAVGDQELDRQERRKARRNAAGYVAKLKDAGIGGALYSQAGEPLKLGSGQVAHMALYSKIRLTTAKPAEIVARGGDLKGKLTALASAILWFPIAEDAPTVQLVQRKPSPRGRKPKARPALPANTKS